MTTTTTTQSTATIDIPAGARRWGRWALAAGAVVAVSATAVVLRNSSDDPTPAPRPAQELTTGQRRQAAVLAALAEVAREQGLTGLSPMSLTPIDRAVRPNSVSETVAAHGSASAIDHRDQAATGRNTPSQTVAEHGSISAIEHRQGNR